jgi:hypothetical protein
MTTIAATYIPRLHQDDFEELAWRIRGRPTAVAIRARPLLRRSRVRHAGERPSFG